ncbi:hypothetical protein LIA77_00470 [Sarocladium implicatum]|nr:hypothetical protein LIA77_00470 [Sarocladium implicatum]
MDGGGGGGGGHQRAGGQLSKSRVSQMPGLAPAISFLVRVNRPLRYYYSNVPLSLTLYHQIYSRRHPARNLGRLNNLYPRYSIIRRSRQTCITPFGHKRRLMISRMAALACSAAGA